MNLLPTNPISGNYYIYGAGFQTLEHGERSFNDQWCGVLDESERRPVGKQYNPEHDMPATASLLSSLRSLPSLALLTFTQRTPLSASNAVYFCVYIVDLRSGCRLVLQTADCDGLKGKSNSAGDVVIAQLTVPTGKPYEVTDPVLYVSCSRKRDDLYLQTHTLWGSA